MESKSKIEDTFENFKIIEEINEKFICKCSKLLIQPKLCFSCSTSFCKSCQMDRGMCPDCGEKLVINLHVDQKIGNLRIKCLVCGEELNVEEIEKHRKEEKEKKEKEEEVVECEGCLSKLNVGLIEGHQKECCAFLLKRINFLNELVEEMQFKAKDYRDKWQKALLEKELLEKKEEPKIQDDPKKKQKKKEIERLLLCFKHMDSGDLERAKKICLEKILEGNKCAKALKYYCGWGINKNVNKALELFCELAEEDKERKNELTPFSLFWVGFIYHQGAGGVKKDIKKAIEFYEKAAKLNHLDAMFYLATIYHKGEIGVKKEVKKAIELYDKAIQFGHTDSIFTLGFIYHKGEEGFKPDVKKAIQIYEKGVSLNDTDALFYLAEIYQNGEGGVKKDIKKAIQLYEKAVLVNNSDAMFNLAQIYQSGDGVQKDLNKAIQLYKRSSELGNEQAMFCLFLLSNNKK